MKCCLCLWLCDDMCQTNYAEWERVVEFYMLSVKQQLFVSVVTFPNRILNFRLSHHENGHINFFSFRLQKRLSKWGTISFKLVPVVDKQSLYLLHVEWTFQNEQVDAVEVGASPLILQLNAWSIQSIISVRRSSFARSSFYRRALG